MNAKVNDGKEFRQMQGGIAFDECCVHTSRHIHGMYEIASLGTEKEHEELRREEMVGMKVFDIPRDFLQSRNDWKERINPSPLFEIYCKGSIGRRCNGSLI